MEIMNEHIVRLTTDLIDRLTDDLRTGQSKPLDEHLTDEELVDFVQDLVPPDVFARLDAHLEVCSTCAERAALLLDAVPELGIPGRDQGAVAVQVRARVLDTPPNIGSVIIDTGHRSIEELFTRLETRLRELCRVGAINFALPPVRAQVASHARAKTFHLQDVATGDTSFDVRTSENKQGDMLLHIAVLTTEAKQRHVRLKIDEQEYIVPLRRVNAGQVSARIVIPKVERERLWGRLRSHDDLNIELEVIEGRGGDASETPQ